MKKTWICLTTLLLLLISSVALAENEIVFYCSSCNAERIGIKSDTYEYFNQDVHIQRIICQVCNNKGRSIRSAHTETKAATCQSPAYCGACQSYYGNPAHDKVQHEAKAPTCTTIGWDAYETCSRCDYTTYVEKTAKGHDRVSHDAKAPTCTTIGWDAYDTCSRCDYTTYVEKIALGHDRVSHDAKAPTCTTIGWDAYETCSRCDYTTYVEKTAQGHDRVSHDAKAPTCTTIGWDAYETCSRCDYSTYVEKSALGHDIVKHDAQAPTCTAIGWEAYDTCSHCDYTTYVELPALGHDYQAKIIPRTCEDDGYTLHTCTRCADRYADTIVPHCGHWYGEWTANGDGTQRAECLRGGCHHEKTVDCEIIELSALNISLCPVCGTASDGSRLALTNASVKIVSGRIPHGEALLRVGTLANGEKLLTVGYVYGGQLSKASCQVKITLPAGLLEGHTLSLLAEDGTETELTDVQDGSFVLDFSGASSPVQVIRLVPQAE